MYISGTNPEFVAREAENASSGLWSPLRDKNAIPRVNELFGDWVSAYFSPIAQLPSFDPVHYEATHDIMHTRKSLDKPPTSTRLTANIGYDNWWFVSSNLRQIQPEILRENVFRSLSRLEDSGEEERSWGLHSKFKAILIWCDQSATDCILGASAIKQYHEEWKRQGHQMRPLEVEKIEDANHFVGVVQ